GGPVSPAEKHLMRAVVVRYGDVREVRDGVANAVDGATRGDERDPRDLDTLGGEALDERVDVGGGDHLGRRDAVPLADAVTGEHVGADADRAERPVEEPTDGDDPQPELLQVVEAFGEVERKGEVARDVVDLGLEARVHAGKQEGNLV